MVLLGTRNRHALGRWIKHSMSSVLWFPSLLSCWLGKPSRQRLCFPCAARFVRKDFYRGQCSNILIPGMRLAHAKQRGTGEFRFSKVIHERGERGDGGSAAPRASANLFLKCISHSRLQAAFSP